MCKADRQPLVDGLDAILKTFLGARYKEVEFINVSKRSINATSLHIALSRFSPAGLPSAHSEFNADLLRGARHPGPRISKKTRTRPKTVSPYMIAVRGHNNERTNAFPICHGLMAAGQASKIDVPVPPARAAPGPARPSVDCRGCNSDQHRISQETNSAVTSLPRFSPVSLSLSLSPSPPSCPLGRAVRLPPLSLVLCFGSARRIAMAMSVDDGVNEVNSRQ